MSHTDKTQVVEPQELSHQKTRRNFITKFGKLAIATPVALTALMAPNTSHAINSNACKNKPNKPKCQNLNSNGF